MRRRRGPPSFILVVLAAFLGLLIWPQLGTLHHNHPGGEHLHTHIPPLTSPIPEDDQAHHTRHHHLHATGRSHVHPHPRLKGKGQQPTQTTATQISSDSANAGHWHTFQTLPLSSFDTPPLFAPRRIVQPVLPQAEQVFGVAPLPSFQPRAPPFRI